MATFITSSNITSATNDSARYRNFISTIISGALEVGLVKVDAVGELDATTIVGPSTTGDSDGFTMLRFNDTLHSSAPIFIRLDFGRFMPQAGQASIAISVGHFHDGSGSVYRPGSEMYVTSSTNETTTVIREHCFSSGDGYFICTHANGAGLFVIERTLDSDGNYTSKGFSLYGSGWPANFAHRPGAGGSCTFYYNSGSSPIFNRMHSLLPSTTSSLVDGNTIISPPYPIYDGFIQPGKSFFVARRAEFPSDTYITASFYGGGAGYKVFARDATYRLVGQRMTFTENSYGIRWV